ncbi:uncharacterized protein LOC110989561 isoform X3 [Acanthaster planci]|uniref:Uncharacterized protein LOC110989561 isoform X3 n=1 Tax=Acanthaster planci TaxID=133434 RepID=A0A8B7ZYB6_ACAPL|nr:uncharacterized protein LOC110989561 isoform X3 [Acanthaster planci]
MGRQETAGPTAVVLLLVAVLGMVQRNEVNATTVDQFQFENSIYTVAEDVGMATVYVLRIEPHDPTSPQVDVATSDGTATNGVDYISKTDTLSFSPTNNRVPFSVSIVDNTVDNSLSDIRCFTLSLTNPNPSSGQLGPNAQVCIRDNDNFFGGTCPPTEAVIESNGEPVIEVSVTSDSATAVVSWTDPTTTGMNMVYNCFPSMSAADTECMNGGAFPITTTIADNNGRIRVQYTVYESFFPTVVIHDCEFYLRVLDPIPPVITCPANLQVPAGDDFMNGTADWMVPVGTDNSGQVTTTGPMVTPPVVLDIGTHTFTYSAMDSSGNVASCSFNVSVTDLTDPVIECPANITTDTDSMERFATVMWYAPNVTDNSGETIEPLLSQPSGSQFEIGNHEVIVNATDSQGNTGNCSFTIEVQDNENPVIKCPANLTVATNSSVDNVTLALPELASASDNSGSFSVSIDVAGDMYMIGDLITLDLATGQHFVQYTATDNYTNSEMCEMHINVTDDEAPMIMCPQNEMGTTDEGLRTGNISFGQATVSDNSMQTVNVTVNATSDSAFPIGETIVQFVATDESSNMNECFITITVTDDENPTIECPGDIEVDADMGENFATVDWFPPNVTDNSGESITPMLSHSSGDQFPFGPTVVIVNATDSHSNFASCNFTVNVLDNEPPIIMCPANQTNATDFRAADVTLPLPDAVSASDNSGQYNITIDVAGATYRVGDSVTLDLATGEHLLQYTIFDAAMNNDTCDMYITVIDTEDPQIICPSLGPVRTDPGLDTANVTFDSANVTDNSMLSITPVANPMSGSIFSIGDTSVQFNATDESGNTASCMFTVTVQDMENPELNCTNFTYPTSPGLPSASIDFIEPTATDNVEVSVVNCFKDGSGVGAVLSVDIGTESVNCVARDNSNNLVSCEFFITVEDTESPNITCPANRNVSTDGGQDFATLTLPSLDSSVDNSGYFTVSIDVAGTRYNVGDPVMLSLGEGVHLVEYTATDNATNSEMCNMTVTVIDDEPPIITCPSMADDNTHPGSPNGTVVFANATVTDNSGMSIELVANATSGVTLFPIGDTLVEFIATDNSGNSANCTFIVRILDMEAPSIECPDNIVVDTDPGQDYANVTWFPPNVTDNSGEDIMPTLSRDSGDRFDIGTVMVSVNAQDSSNNPNFCFFSVTVQDNEPPTIMCPANQTNSTDFRAADVTLPLPDAVSASDNAGQYNITIDVAGTTYRVGDSVTFDLATGEHLLQYIITDDAMNNDTCDAYIIVIDEEDPVLVCPGDDLLVVPDGQVNASITWSEPLVTDNSGNALMAVASQENGTMVPIGEVITIVYNATDSAGNVGYCNFTITVIDNVPPVITCPSNVSRPTAFNQSYGPVTWDQPTVTDNVPRTVTVTSDHVNGSNFDLGDTIVTLTATDAAMNNDTCQFKVTVIDEEKPVILNCPASFNITTISGQSYGIPNFTEPTAQDNSGSVTIAGLGRTGNQFPIGPHAIVYVAIDDANNNEVCRLTLLVIDEEKPTLQAPSQCPTDIVVFIQDMNSDNTTVMWTEPVFVDNSGMAPTVTVTPLTNNSPFPEGNTTVTIAAADTAGNTLECVFLVTVNVFDMTPPTLSPCPPWFAPVMTDPGSDTASPFDFGVAANDSGSGVESEVLSVSEPLAIGDNFVSLSARDFAGNVGYCNFTVTVTDAERPNITSCPGNDTVSTRLDSPYGFPTWMDPTAVDNSGSVMVNCSKQSGDAFDIGNTTVVCTAEDPSNNTDMCSFIITVEDNQSPTVTFCPGNINKQTDQGLATAITTFGQPTGADNDGIPIVPVGSHTNGSAFDLGVTQVSFSFMDSSGNVAYCNFTVTVVDGEPPTAGDTCPNDTMVFTPTGRPTSPVLWTPPTLTDNVGVVNTTNSHSSNDEFPIGITPVVYTATDAAGNVGRCEFMVEVQDTEDPVFDLCPLPIRQPTDPSEPFATVSWTVPNVTDNSNNIASMDASHQPGQTFPIGSHTVTYTAVDQDSNIGTCSFAVVVFDNENPVVENCQSNVTLYVPSNSTQLSASWPFPNATDNAGPPTVFNATYTEITVVSRSPVNVTIDWQVGFETVTLFHIGCYRSVIRVQDDAGNVVECITTVWIFDLIPPVFDVCPPVLDVSYPTDLNLPSAVVNWTPLSATDNTGGPVTLVRSHMTGQAFDIGVTTVTVNATDESGNLATCVFNITVVDEQQPNVTCPSGFEVYTNPQSNVSTGRWSLPSDAFDNSNFYVESSSRDPADPLGVGNHHVSYNVTDRAGNQASCNFYITVRDNENPYFEPCPVSFSSPTDPQESTANVTWLPVIAMDNVGVQEFNSSHQPGDLFQIGDTLVTYNVTDTSGNKGSCSFVVTVEDTQPPSITCPGPAIITNTDPDQNVANVTFTAAAADNSGEWTLSCTPPSGSNFSIGADSVICIATDPSNNPASCFFAVVVSDNQEPVFQNCPSNVILNEPLESFFDNFTIAVNWTPPVVTDNVGVVQLDVTNEPGSVFGIGSHSVTYTARDEANNMATCQFNVIVNDVQPPVITGCPMNLPRFPTDPGLNISRATWMEPQASDNSGTVTLTSNYVRGDAFSVGNTTVVYTALDDSGNSVNCSFVIQVYDNQPPEFTGCPIQGVTNDTSLRSDRGVAWWTTPQPTDNVDVASVQSDYQPGSSFPLGPTVVTYNATDTAGLMAQCSFTVLIQDNEMPVIECPAQVSVSTFTHQGGTNVTYPTVNATDYASGLSTLSCSMNSGAYFPIGSNNVICTAEDRANNMRVCIFAVIVVGMDDNVPPVISNCPANMTHPADNTSTATIVSWTPPTASDNSGDPVNLMMSAAPGSAFEIGVTVVTYTATDGVGLISTCIFSITILDLSSPVILQCPGNITQPTDPSMDSAVVDWASPGAVDNSGTVTLMASTTPGSEFPIGVTTVVYTATDLDNNVERCSFQINITDEEDPVITGCPSVQLERETETGQNYSLVMWDEITVHDNSGNWTVDTSGPSQGRISVGVHQVSYVATDLSGNLAECSFSIRVSDTELPQFTNCPTAIIKLVNQSGLSAVVTWDPLVITDNVGVDLATLMGSHNSGDTFTFGGPTTVMYNVTDVSGNTNICRFTVTVSDAPAALSNCPVYIQRPTDPGQASAVVTWDSPDVEPVGASVDISSTPYASGDTIPLGRYNITHQATINRDFLNIQECFFVVEVIDNEPPTWIVCPTGESVNPSAGSDTAPVFWAQPEAQDNSGSVNVSPGSHVNGSQFPVGLTTVTYNASDDAGHVITCSFVVTVQDVLKPNVTCPDSFSLNTDPNKGTATMTWMDAQASDNVAVTSLVSSPANGSPLPVGLNTITYTATDAAQNTITCSFNITVIDNEPPRFSNCPAMASAVAATDQDMATVTWDLPSASDNAITVTVEASHSSAVLYPLGVTPVVYLATDGSGNRANCTFDVTVTDAQDPVFTNCPGNLSANTAMDQAIATGVIWTPPTASDNDPLLQTTNNYDPPANFSIGVHIVNYTAVDRANNKATCIFTVTVTDMQDPVYTGCPASFSIPAQVGTTMANVSWVEPSASDNVAVNSSVSNVSPNTIFDFGVTTVEYTAQDQAGNIGKCTFNVTVLDSTAPMLVNCPSDQVFCANLGTLSRNVSWNEPTATDNEGAVTLVSDHTPGSTFNHNDGTPTPVTYTATDESGLQASCTFNVIIRDCEDPVFTDCPSGFVEPGDSGGSSTSVQWTEPTATDNSGQVDVNRTHIPGSIFTVDTSPVFVQYTAVDRSGNSNTCTFTVVVTDNTPPVIRNCPSNNTILTDSNSNTGSASWTPPTVDSTPTDPVTLMPSHEPGASFPIGTHSVTYTARDANGNEATCIFWITVRDGQNPTLTNCPESFTLTVAQAADQVIADWTPPTASDNSGSVTLTTTFEPGQLLGPGQYPVVYTAMDSAGLTATCMFTVTIQIDIGCNPSPCNNGGTCTPVGSDGFTCSCTRFWMGTTCDEDVNECTSTSVIAECSARGLVCVNKLDPVGYSCECPNGFVRVGNTDNCRQGRRFRIVIFIIEINGIVAVFVTDLNNRNSVIFLIRQRDLEALFDQVFGGLPGFGNSVVLFFGTGSIAVNALITFDPDSTVTQTDVNNALQQAINSNDLLMGSIYKVTPSASQVIEEVCLDGYCQNGGTCVPDTVTFLSSCTCHSGYVGNRCESEVIDVNNCTSTSVIAECSARGLVCVNKLDPVGYSCECPNGFVRVGNTDNCRQGRRFRIVLVIVEINETTAVFLTILNNRNSVIFLTRQRDLEDLFNQAFGGLPGFSNSIVLSFNSGSIVVNALITFDLDSTVTQTDVNNALQQAIDSNDLLMGSIYKVTPSASQVIEEVCLDGYCQNGGTCVPDTVTFLSSCICPSGYVGNRCESGDVTTTPPPSGDGLSTEVIIAIAVGTALALLLLLLIVFCLCFLMKQERKRATTGYLYAEDHEGQRGPTQYNGSLYDVQFGPKDNNGFLRTPSQFSVPYVASGAIPLHRLRERNDADYY